MVERDLCFGVEDSVHHLIKGDMLGLGDNVLRDLSTKAKCMAKLSLRNAATL